MFWKERNRTNNEMEKHKRNIEGIQIQQPRQEV